ERLGKGQLAATYLKLGDVRSNRRDRLAQYREALRISQSLPDKDPEKGLAVMEAMFKIAPALGDLGDMAGALETYRAMLPHARALKRAGLTAFCQERIAYFSAVQGETEGAEDLAQQAVGYYQNAKKPQPRNVAKAYKTLAEV